MGDLNRNRLARLTERETERYAAEHPRSRAAAASARHLFGGVPMTWMAKWAGGFPLHLDSARGSTVVDVDGNTYVDLALGDTGAMAGHAPAATVQAVTAHLQERGALTTMLPTVDGELAAAELARRFGLPLWSFTLSATDANRWAIRLARLATGRPKILVFAYGYHGSVDEAFALPGPDGVAVARPGNVGPPVPLDLTTRVVEFNDLDAVRRELAHGDVAAVLMEPALTNIGIVLPDEGFLAGVREATARTGTLLIIDETHTFSLGPGGATAAWGLQPDVLVIGKSIGGGIPCGAYGLSAELAQAVQADPDADLVDVGGVGGTLAGNALSTAAIRATLTEVLTADAFQHMSAMSARFVAGVRRTIDSTAAPWSVVGLGARAEYRFTTPAPRSGTASAAAADDDLDAYLHLALANRGVLITPFHAMALMAPTTTAQDVDRHTEAFAEIVTELLAG